MYIVLAILIFSFLIFIHEFGHFLAAKAFGVKVNEFSVFMGPRLVHWGKGETEYSIRLLPVGGFCAMEGEDGESDDPRSFVAQAPWKRCIILAAGAFMNFLTGLVIVLVIFAGAKGFYAPVITDFEADCHLESAEGLQVGDRFVSINGEKIYVRSDVGTLLSIYEAKPNMDIEVERDGKTVLLKNFDMSKQTFDIDGQEQELYGFSMAQTEDATVFRTLRESWYTCVDFVRYVRLSITMLVTGQAGLKDMSGPVGIVTAIQETGKSSSTVWDALENIFYFGALLAVNLAVMNMLPIPGLDGGHIFLLLVTWVIEKISRKKLNPKYENYVHLAGLVALMGLMVVVTWNDIIRLFTGG